MVSKEYAIGRRNDISSFLVHFTRKYPRQFKFKIARMRKYVTAEEALHKILRDRQILALNFHCLFNRELANMNLEEVEHFKTVCFTEIPLSDINYLVQQIEGRNINLSQYGLVFRKSTVVSKGGNPVIYVSNKPRGGPALKAFWQTFRRAKKHGFSEALETAYLPFVNCFTGKHDFSWEREWRHCGKFTFAMSEVFLGLAPATDLKNMQQKYPMIAWISPRWGRDQILEALQVRGNTLAEEDKLVLDEEE